MPSQAIVCSRAGMLVAKVTLLAFAAAPLHASVSLAVARHDLAR